ncbi:MAG: OmpA family protein [Chitinophagales bacterium]|nr:OmpA family protein [Chitinophagales bacterium]
MKKTISLFVLQFIFLFLIAQKEKKIVKELFNYNDSIIAYQNNIDIKLLYNIPDSLMQMSYKKLKKMGNNYKNEYAYTKAGKYFTAAVAKTKKSKKKSWAYYNGAIMLYKKKDYDHALQFFQLAKANNKKQKKYLDSDFYIGDIKLHFEDYNQAKKYLRDFNKKVGDKKDYAFLKSKALVLLRSCNFALDTIQTPSKYNLYEIPIFKSWHTKDGMDVRDKELVYTRKFDKDAENAKTIIHTIMPDNRGFDFSSSINYDEDAKGNPSFTEDGNTIYFSKCKVQNEELTDCNIYVSYLENGIWTKPEKLNENINEPNSNATQPQIVVDENGVELLYFVAEREKGRGGKDIWYAVKDENGNFGRAKNLGYPINTKFDDVAPFYHTQTHTLYFSTEGKEGYGGLDVFESTKVNDEFEEPVNMGKPVNSSFDDIDFMLDKKLQKGYIATNRYRTYNSNCCNNIYKVKTTDYEVYAMGNIYEETENTREKINNAVLFFKNAMLDSLDFELTIDSGFYYTEIAKKSIYNVTVSNDDFEDEEFLVSTMEINEEDTIYNDVFFRNRLNFSQRLYATVYYEFNQSDLTKEAPKTLEKVLTFLEENPDYNVAVKSHTDNSGSDSYNMSLSKRRGEAVVRYLEFYGVNRDRISSSWYGESKPKASNSTGKGMAQNRRTEFWVERK